MQTASSRPKDISEDCLFLNIYTPTAALNGSVSPVPIMMWIHGGGWTAGSGNSYDGTKLASRQNIMVVAINYRLGNLGFYASEELAKEPASLGSTGGMNGIRDQITALHWLHANAHRFGGDPKQLTIAGESAGAESVCNLLIAPPAKGLFQRAIIESGPCIGYAGSELGWGAHPKSLALAASAKAMKNRTLAELRAVEDGYTLLGSGSGMDKVEDSVDDYILPLLPGGSAAPAYSRFQNATLNADAVLLGGNSFDGLESYYVKYEVNPLTHRMPEFLYHSAMNSHFGQNAKAVEALYPTSRFASGTNGAAVQPIGDAGVICPTLELANVLTSRGHRAYTYLFSYGPVCGDVMGHTMKLTGGPGWASHASEIPWVFGTYDICYRNESEVRLTQDMQDLWGSFVRTGKPQAANLTWSAYESGRGNTMLLDLDSRMVDGLKTKDCLGLLAINSTFWPNTAQKTVVEEDMEPRAPSLPPPPPSYWACLDAAARQSYKFCNTSVPLDDRVADFVGRLTLDEKIKMLSPDETLGSGCNDHTNGVPRLDVPQYMWLVETNTGVNSACYGQGKCATTFPGPMGMAASFNRSAWRLKGETLGAELRAFNNLRWHRDAGGTTSEKIGLTGFGPNINIARDPRFGRSSELPGEDPVLSGIYASEMVRGMQKRDVHGYPMMLAYLKHFSAYSRETNRGHDNYNISQFDLFDTYLPQYRYAFKHSNASGAMCSYNAVNGHPSCANDYVLNTLLRSWAPHAIVTSDCGAVTNLRGPPISAPTMAAAAAYALNNGTDLEMGSTAYRIGLHTAVQSKLTTEAIVTRAVTRTQRQLFTLGRYDPVEASSWTSLGAETLNSTRHQQIAYEAGLQSLVLLLNDGNALPLKSAATKSIAVLGPMADARKSLLSDYYGDDVCSVKGGCSGHECYSCIPSIFESVSRQNSNGSTKMAQGVAVNSTDTSGVQAAITLAKQSDVLILALGIDRTIEREGIDRTDTKLPGLQSSFALDILRLNKPTIIVLINGGALAIDELLQPRKAPYAIIEAFNPNVVGGKPIAAAIFGKENRWGKLPVTMYPHAFLTQKPMTDYNISSGVGRTYRYYTKKPLFPFGHGLSYTTFHTNCTLGRPSSGLSLSCDVRNTGNVDGEEIVMMYHSVGSSIRKQLNHPAPKRALLDFARVYVPAGEVVRIPFDVPEESFQIVDNAGDRVLYKGEHILEVTGEGAGAPGRQILYVVVGL